MAVQRSCSPGLYFSRSQLRCVRRADSDCLLDNESCPAENDPENVVFLPDQEDCQRFFQRFFIIRNIFQSYFKFADILYVTTANQ